MVGLTSYYGKCFISRNQNSVSNIAKWLSKKINLKVAEGVITDVTKSSAPRVDRDLPRIYSAVAETFMGFTIEQYKFYWNLNKINEVFNENEISLLKNDDLIPCGHSPNGVLGMDSKGVIHELKDGKNVMLKSFIYFIDPDISDPPFEYSEISVFSRRIPLGVAFSFIYGFDNFLKKCAIPFSVEPSNKRLDKDIQNYLYIQFKDLTYIINIRKQEHMLLMAGWNSVAKSIKVYNSSAFNKQTVYSNILNSSSITGQHFKELKLMWDMYIDPITKGILEEMKEPTEFDKLLLRANELLINDFTPKYSQTRIKGYERIAGTIYEEMINGIRSYRSQNVQSKAQININPQAVWLKIIQDPSVGLVEESNPLHNLKESETVTYSGRGGRSSETMVKETRGFNDDDLGVYSEASPDSGNIGIITYLSANANITSLRGLTEKYNEDENGPASLLSSPALISPSVTHDDFNLMNYIAFI